MVGWPSVAPCFRRWKAQLPARSGSQRFETDGGADFLLCLKSCRPPQAPNRTSSSLEVHKNG